MVVSSRPPLPPVTRVIPAAVSGDEQSTLPGWVAALIYLACSVIMVLIVLPRLV